MLDPIWSWVVGAADPANLVLVGVVWWRLDRRMRDLRDDLRRHRAASERPQSVPEKNEG